MSEQQKEQQKEISAEDADDMIKELESIPNLTFKLPSKEEREWIKEMSTEIVESNFFGEKNVMAARIKVRACLLLKIDPVLFYSQIQIMEFKGKKILTQSAYLMSYLILRSFPLAIKSQGWSGTGDDFGFRMLVHRPGRLPKPFSFTIGDAKRAKLIQIQPDGKLFAKNENWFKYEKDMLRSRTITQCGRTEFPDVLGGIIYSPEDLGGHIAPPKKKRIINPKEIDMDLLGEEDPEFAALMTDGMGKVD